MTNNGGLGMTKRGIEDVIITKSGNPLVKRMPVDGQEGERPLGCCDGMVTFTKDVLEPLPDEIIARFFP